MTPPATGPRGLDEGAAAHPGRRRAVPLAVHEACADLAASLADGHRACRGAGTGHHAWCVTVPPGLTVPLGGRAPAPEDEGRTTARPPTDPVSDSRRSAEELSVAAALLCLALAPVLSGCGSTLTEQSGGGVSGLPEWKPFRYASPAPGVPWRIKPDKADAIPGERQPGVPAALQPVASSLTLPQLLAVALDNTPATRQAWEQARSAAAAWGAARGEYYPAATIGAQGLVSRGSSSREHEHGGRRGRRLAGAGRRGARQSSR